MNKNENLLFERFQFFGRKHFEYRNKCIGLLPEIYRQKIHIKKGFDSIFEFAARFAGLSNEQVRRVLSLNEKFTDKPILKNLLEKGEVSLSKLARVASVATTDNEEFWAAQAKLLPNSALETLVRDQKLTAAQEKVETQIDDKFVRAHKLEELELSSEVVQKLSELKAKGHDLNAIILEMLKKREKEIARKKEEISQEIRASDKKATRYVPVKVKNILKEEYGTKCAIKNCNKPSVPCHHTDRFGLSQHHDPNYMAPLCEDHHKIAHSIDISYQEIRSKALK